MVMESSKNSHELGEKLLLSRRGVERQEKNHQSFADVTQTSPKKTVRKENLRWPAPAGENKTGGAATTPKEKGRNSTWFAERDGHAMRRRFGPWMGVLARRSRNSEREEGNLCGGN